jgi:glycosyltransferase involved in cell wall biosynthesis
MHQGLWTIAERLNEWGHKVSIVSHKNPSGQEEIEKGDISIYFLSNAEEFSSVQDFSNAAEKKILEIHKADPVDHIHSLDTPLRNHKNFWSKIKNKPQLSYSVQSTSIENFFDLFGSVKPKIGSLLLSTFIYPILFLKKFFLKDYLTLRQASAVFVSSPKQALALERYYLFPPNSIFQVPLDSFMISLMLRSKSKKLLESLDLNPETPVIATASNMKRTDDMFFLLDVFERISLLHPKSKFLIIGDGEHFKDVEHRILLKALDSKVIMTKNIAPTSLPDFIALSDVFVNLDPSSSGLGRTLVEAMSQKKVIIGSELSPIANIIAHGVNGYLIRPEDTQQCAKLIDRLFSSPEKRLELGEQARKDVLSIFDQEILTKKALSAFQTVQKRKSLFRQLFFN